MLSQGKTIISQVADYGKLVTWREKYHVEREADKGKRKNWTHYVLSPVYENTADSISDTAVAYLQQASRIMAYTAIRTAYVKSGHPYLWTLMQSATADRDITAQNQLAHDITTTTDSKYRYQLGIHHRKTVKYKVAGKILRKTILVDDESDTLQTLKFHRNGIPYLAMTDTGNAMMRSTADSYTHADYNDCVSIAFTALWERIDTFTTFADVWQVRRYVYREVNQYLHGQRKQQVEQDRFRQYVTFTDEEGNEHDMTVGQADKRIGSIMDDSAIESIVKYVCDNVRKDARGNMAMVLRCRLNGMTTREIASARGHKSDRNTVRLMARARQILSTPDGKALLSDLIG